MTGLTKDWSPRAAGGHPGLAFGPQQDLNRPDDTQYQEYIAKGSSDWSGQLPESCRQVETGREGL